LRRSPDPAGLGDSTDWPRWESPSPERIPVDKTCCPESRISQSSDTFPLVQLCNWYNRARDVSLFLHGLRHGGDASPRRRDRRERRREYPRAARSDIRIRKGETQGEHRQTATAPGRARPEAGASEASGERSGPAGEPARSSWRNRRGASRRATRKAEIVRAPRSSGASEASGAISRASTEAEGPPGGLEREGAGAREHSDRSDRQGATGASTPERPAGANCGPHATDQPEARACPRPGSEAVSRRPPGAGNVIDAHPSRRCDP
jgi:hypothetical protein